MMIRHSWRGGGSRISRASRPLLASVLVIAAAFAFEATQGAMAAEETKKDESAKSEEELERQLADARKRLDAAAREVAELSRALSETIVPQVGYAIGRTMQRAVLGINVGSRDAGGSDDGVKIVSVSPGGPADEAGLRAGDVILELNGTKLERSGDRSPRARLLDLMRDVEPHEKVTVTYRRGGKVSKTTVTARPLIDHVVAMALPKHGEHWPAPITGRHGMFFGPIGAFGSAELVALTPKLGQYFGTDQGLLVVRAPEDERLKLEDGDVILDIDGRTPSSPSHALRILSSYQAGERLTLNVLRNKKKMSIEVTIPEDAPRASREMGHLMMPGLPAPGRRIERHELRSPDAGTIQIRSALPEDAV
ncbi:MAG TPA: PDZ domain-containing protein [Steroidobacter sp.]